MTPEEQLTKWVRGNPVHDHARGECCPDFSCCERSLLVPKNVREKFRDADTTTRHGMLTHFISAAIEKASELKDVKVSVIGHGAKH